MKTFFKSILLIVTILMVNLLPVSADTIRQMQYNLLYYTAPENAPDGCTNDNNNLDQKDAALKLIVKEVMPDVLCVNEIGKQDFYANRILNNVLNTDGVTYYAYLPAGSNSGTRTIGNRLFYDTRKLALKERTDVPTYNGGTIINLYKMYYKSTGLAQGDTTFITFIVWHLAASGDTVRYEQSRILTNFMSGHPSVLAPNFVLSGDFNAYSSSDQAFSNLTENSNLNVRFYDPVQATGDWHDNSSFAAYFTQSTHAGTQTYPYCAPGGGMDDRFDFILVSQNIFRGFSKVHCLPQTYHALGQDGLRWNQSITNPLNTVVTPAIANALYTVSDHLPVIMDYAIDEELSVNETVAELPVSIVNPVSDQLDIRFSLLHADQVTVSIYGMDGKLLHQELCCASGGANHITMEFPYRPSCYLVRISDSKGHNCVRKVIKAQ